MMKIYSFFTFLFFSFLPSSSFSFLLLDYFSSLIFFNPSYLFFNLLMAYRRVSSVHSFIMILSSLPFFFSSSLYTIFRVFLRDSLVYTDFFISDLKISSILSKFICGLRGSSFFSFWASNVCRLTPNSSLKML